MTTSFQLMSTQWIDIDLPVTYQFGFTSPSGVMLIVQLRSELSYTTSQFPAGASDLNYQLTAVLTVLDALSASVTNGAVVQVNPVPQSQVQTLVLNSLNASLASGNINTLQQTISVAVAVVSRVNCTAAPNCTALSRAPCSQTASLCGSCLDGYVGNIGDGNSLCSSVLAISSSFDLPTGSCKDDDDCYVWQQCYLVPMIGKVIWYQIVEYLNYK
jgi:hypothetical protein